MSALIGSVGRQTDGVADDAISASSKYGPVCFCEKSIRFGSNYGWSSAGGVLTDAWIKIDLGEMKTISSVQTKGCGTYGWVSSFKISYSTNNRTWSWYNG